MTTAPTARQVPSERTVHGDTVIDHYEWLRAKDDPQVLAHLEAENEYCAARTAHLEPLRGMLFDEIKGRTQEDDTSVATRRGEWWYYSRTIEGSPYAVHCRCPAGPRDAADAWTPPVTDTGAPVPGEQVLLDGNAEAQGHDYFAVGALEVSTDDRLLAYSVDTTGDERFTLRCKDLDTGELLADEVPGVFYSAVWARDSASLFYLVVDDAWRPYQVRRHVLGTPLEDDQVVHTESDERFWLGIGTTTDEVYLQLVCGSKTTSEIFVVPLDDPGATPVSVAGRREGVEYSIDHAVVAGRPVFVIVHNDHAEDFAVAIAPVSDPGPQSWEELVPHRAGTRIEDVLALRHALVVSLRRDALMRVMVIPLGADGAGSSWEVPFQDDLFTASAMAPLDAATPLLRVAVQSFVTPAAVYDVDLDSREMLLRKQVPVLGGFSSDDYEQHREWAQAPDGTRIPLSIVCRAGTRPDGRNPVVLYGYGSYETSIDPAFGVPRLSLLDRGVVFVVAHVRGGGELGRQWYEQGKMMHKTNSFTDFVACAQRVVESGWADPARLAAMGGSAGGLLMGAVTNLAPQQFCGVLAQVPFVDPLTSVLDPSLPLTVIEWEEWGDPLHDPEVYRYMKGYSPYENVAELDYPPILAMTSLHDTRVLYVEPAKWVARLREVAPGGGPYLLRTEMHGGHGGASGRYETWRERAYEMSWLIDRLGATTDADATAGDDAVQCATVAGAD